MLKTPSVDSPENIDEAHPNEVTRRVSISGSNLSNIPPPLQSFAELGIDEKFLKKTANVFFQKPTIKQKYVMPCILEGYNIFCYDRDDYDTTATYLLPIFGYLMNAIKSHEPIMPTVTSSGQHEVTILILCSTYNSVCSIWADCGTLKRTLSSEVSLYAIRNEESIPHLSKFTRGINIITSTPRNMWIHVNAGKISFSKLKCIIFDDAAVLLNPSHISYDKHMLYIDSLLSHNSMPKTSQILMFSTSASSKVQNNAQRYLSTDYLFCSVCNIDSFSDIAEVRQRKPELFISQKDSPSNGRIKINKTANGQEIVVPEYSGSRFSTNNDESDDDTVSKNQNAVKELLSKLITAEIRNVQLGLMCKSKDYCHLNENILKLLEMVNNLNVKLTNRSFESMPVNRQERLKNMKTQIYAMKNCFEEFEVQLSSKIGHLCKDLKDNFGFLLNTDDSSNDDFILDLSSKLHSEYIDSVQRNLRELIMIYNDSLKKKFNDDAAALVNAGKGNDNNEIRKDLFTTKEQNSRPIRRSTPTGLSQDRIGEKKNSPPSTYQPDHFSSPGKCADDDDKSSGISMASLMIDKLLATGQYKNSQKEHENLSEFSEMQYKEPIQTKYSSPPSKVSLSKHRNKSTISSGIAANFDVTTERRQTANFATKYPEGYASKDFPGGIFPSKIDESKRSYISYRGGYGLVSYEDESDEINAAATSIAAMRLPQTEKNSSSLTVSADEDNRMREYNVISKNHRQQQLNGRERNAENTIFLMGPSDFEKK